MSDDVTPLELFYGDLEWIEEHCRIVTKAGTIEPIRFNYAQGRVINACVRQLKSGRPIRVIVLKARQLGVSTLIQSLLFARSARRSGVRGVLIAHQDDSTKKIWRMQGVFASHSGSGEFIKSFAEADGPLVWQHNSRLSCMTAGGKDIAHGETINFLHLSEASRYGEGQSPEQQARVVQTVTGINAAVAKTPDSAVFIESTANGYGNWFEQAWHKAVGGEIDYEPVFIPWFEHPEYTRHPSFGPIRNDQGCDPVEVDLRSQYGLSLEQLNWRRYTIANDCNGDDRLFREQYPASAEEAFLVSGSNVFDSETVKLYLQTAKEPLWRGDIRYVAQKGWQLVEDPRGPLCVWFQPSDRDDYAMFADPAKFHDTQNDYWAAVVRRASDSAVVATLMGKWEPGEYADKLAALGYLYGEGLIAVEDTASAPAVIGALRGELGGPVMYHRLYRHTRVDQVTGRRSDAYGFPSNWKTKHAAVEAEQRLLRLRQEQCHDIRVWQQMSTFINGKNGKMEAATGCNDDLVTCMCGSALIIQDVFPPMDDVIRRPKLVENIELAESAEDVLGVR